SQIDEILYKFKSEQERVAMSGPAPYVTSANRKQGVVHKSEMGWDLVLVFGADPAPQLFFRATDLLMFDWDKVSEQQCVTALETLIGSIGRNALFRLYKTANGFHGFLVSEPRPPRRVETVSWTTICKADAKFAWM